MAPNLVNPALAALAAFALLPLHASAAAEPKVLGLDFVKVKKDVVTPMSHLQRRADTVEEGLYNAQLLYIANVTIGSPPQQLSLQLDTGSSDLWVPSADSDLCFGQGCSVWGSFEPSNSTSFQEQTDAGKFLIAYGDNSEYEGVYGTDTISVGGATMKDVIFAVVDKASGVVGNGPESNNGLMGVSFDIGESGAELGISEPYPGIVSQLKKNGQINTRSYSLWLNDVNAASGSILFGGVDTSKYTAPLLGLPIVGTNSSDYSKIDRLAVEMTGLSLSDQKGISALGGSFVLPALLDSGTSATLLTEQMAQDVWNSAGVVTDPAIAVPLVACDLQNAQASYIFAFGGDNGPKINVSISQLITEVPGLTFKDGTSACKFGIQKTVDGNIILGDTFLRSAYVVYDLDNKQIAMAQTNLNGGAANIQEISGTTLPGVSTVLPSMTLPASLSQATAAATTELGGPSASPTIADNGRLTELPGKPSFTAQKGGATAAGQKGAASSMAASGDAAFAVFGVVSLLTILGGSTFFRFA